MSCGAAASGVANPTTGASCADPKADRTADKSMFENGTFDIHCTPRPILPAMDYRRRARAFAFGLREPTLATGRPAVAFFRAAGAG